ncbi:MAG: polA, partial [Deltaproteobacteria bacterium]|nr:polA [Deltaproteobacteria bacterium]
AREGEAFYIPVVGSLLEGKTVKVGHDLKKEMILLKKQGVELAEPMFDTMVASYLINPVRSEQTLEAIALEFLGKNVIEQLSGVRDEKSRIDYVCHAAEAIFELKEILSGRLRDEGLEELFYNVEMPLVRVLSDVEMNGVRVDRDFLNEMSKEVDSDLQELMSKIYSLAGQEFNINSPKQLSEVLFEKLKLPAIKKTKTGYSTDVEVLQQLSAIHELPAEILTYRTLSKLKSTYIDSLPSMINPETGRVHTSLNQTVTATGRLSSSEPNLQNIPIRTELGRRIREAFTAEPGNLILSADYSQIELRVMAHMSEDPILIESFKKGEDIHARTAAEVFGIMPGLVTSEMRRMAKVVNFGIIYGMSPFGLSKDLGISQKDAKRYIDSYFEHYKGVSSFIEKTILEAKEKGYVRTLLGRKRPIPELSGKEVALRQFGERTAVNTPIQGTAADIIKLAMINISKRLKKEDLKSLMILQVHDELVFEVPEGELEIMKLLVCEEMEGVMELKVPLKVDIGVGKNWSEAH